MQVVVTFRHMNPSDPLRDHASDRVHKIRKYFPDALDSHVVLSVEKHLHKADIQLSANGMLIRGEEVSGDMYNSIDRASEKIEKQIKRYREKIINHRPREGAKMRLKFKRLEQGVEATTEASDTLPHIVETKEFEARPMILEEALMQMDLMHTDILVFLNVKTDQINVLYRKKSNQFGLIETDNAAKAH